MVYGHCPNILALSRCYCFGLGSTKPQTKKVAAWQGLHAVIL